jgi:hypothetical protein
LQKYSISPAILPFLALSRSRALAPGGLGKQDGEDLLGDLALPKIASVVSGGTVGAGESCDGTRPITSLILVID